MRKLLWVMCGIVVIVGVACRARIELNAERAALLSADREFARHTLERGVDGWVSSFADNGVMFRPGEVVRGHDSIRAFMGPAFADETYSLEWEPRWAEASMAGDLGYTVGRYESRSEDAEGNPAIRTGWHLTIWRKQSDGQWKVELDIGSPDDPPQPTSGN